MESNYVIIDGELYHHGVKGMRWGVRRYQNKDGSLTPKGRKRYSDGAFEQWKAKRAEKAKARAKAKAEAAKKKQEQDAKKADDKVKNAYRKKSASEMTDAELKAAIERAKLEDAYRALRPEEVSQGQKIANAVKNLTISAIESEGKKLLSKLGDKMLEKYFPKEKSALEKLKETAEETKALADIATNKKNKAQADYDITQIGKDKDKDLSWDEKTKKYKLEKEMREDAEKAAEAKKERDAEEAAEAKKERDAEEAAKRTAFDETVDRMNKTARTSRDDSSGRKSARSMYDNTKKSDRVSFKPGDDGYEIQGEGTSKRKTDSSRSNSSNSDFIYYGATWTERTSSQPYSSTTSNTAAVSSGKSYVSGLLNRPLSGLLPPPKKDDD